MPAYGDLYTRFIRCSGLDVHPVKGGSSVDKALPLPEASAGFHCSIWLGLVVCHPCMVWVQGLEFFG